jgi:hypothetical protein
MLAILRLLVMTHTKIQFCLPKCPDGLCSSPNLLFDKYCGYFLTIKQPVYEVDHSSPTPVPWLRKRRPLPALPLYAYVGSTVTVNTKLPTWDIK